MTQHILAISLGPVQEFIATARKTRDLWFGSWLLSELSWAAASRIAEHAGPDSLIFPALDGPLVATQASQRNVANKVVALISSPPVELAADIGERVRSRLAEIADGAFDGLPASVRAAAARQAADLLEYTWAAAPVDDLASYRSARARLDRLLAARKATRDFAPVVWGSDAPKSSLDGLRESVILSSEYPTQRDDAATRLRKTGRLYNQYRAGPAEHLSGVDLLKRLGPPATAPAFPSTSHLAALPFLRGLVDTSATRDAWQRYLQTLRDANVELETTDIAFKTPILDTYDGALLFEERVTEGLESQARDTVKAALRAFLDVAAGRCRPMPYYALLVADGDSMGRVIGAQDSVDAHRALSYALAGFAAAAEEIVARHNGAPVYSGGDDVLALLPLHTALQCATDLALEFRNRLAAFPVDRDGTTPTLSAGLAVCHHLEPLDDALRLARSAEQAAKRVDGKNALAVTVRKRGGAERTVAGHWNDLDARLARYGAWRHDGALTTGFAYELRETARHLSLSDGDGREPLLGRAMQAEAKRIISRKQVEQGSATVPSEVVEEVGRVVQGVPEALALVDELIIAGVLMPMGPRREPVPASGTTTEG